LNDVDKKYHRLFGYVQELADAFENELKPLEPKDCWNKGAAFSLAMEKAVLICEKTFQKI
jgi:hypothetical protein